MKIIIKKAPEGAVSGMIQTSTFDGEKNYRYFDSPEELMRCWNTEYSQIDERDEDLPDFVFFSKNGQSIPSQLWYRDCVKEISDDEEE